MRGYNKEFLIDAYIDRFIQCKEISIETIEILEKNAIALYDRVGKDKFRVYASLDADYLKKYK